LGWVVQNGGKGGEQEAGVGRVVSDISMSLDGFIAGPNNSVENPMGDRGEWLHHWMYPVEGWREPPGLEGGVTEADSRIAEESLTRAGAFLMGRRMFDEGEKPWGDPPPFHKPVFIVTHDAHKQIVKGGGTTYTFVTDGIGRALELAKEAAGERDVAVSGGANVIQQLLAAGLLEELQVHLAPVFLGEGTRLFDRTDLADTGLEATRVIASPRVTHIRFQVGPRRAP
jgi:dihydrofolate reductase